MQCWKLIPFVGIESHFGHLRLGMTMKEVEKIIGSSCINLTDDIGEIGCSLRNYYEYEELENKLDIIEFFNGSLHFEDIEICRTDTKVLKELFVRKGFAFSYCDDPDLGQFCPQLGIYILSDGDCGGEPDNIDCVILSRFLNNQS